jgi:hypothetical protein
MFIPHRKHPWASTACYGDSFSFLCVDYGYLTGNSHGPLRPVTGMALLTFLRRTAVQIEYVRKFRNPAWEERLCRTLMRRPGGAG